MEKANPKCKATTLMTEGVAEPSLSAWALGKERFDLLQLGLEHPLNVLALLIDLCGHLGVQSSDLGVGLL